MATSTIKRWAARITAGIGLLVAVGLLFVRLKYGGGQPYPHVSTSPLLPPERLETLVELEYPPGNVTSAADGRVFFTIHPFGEPQRFTDALLFQLKDGEITPYPNAQAQQDFIGALGLTVDRQQRLWIVRPAGIEDRKTKLYAYDLKSDKRVVDFAFEDGSAPFAQDLRAAPDGETVFLADTGVFRFTPPALIVFDVAAKKARRVLEGHPSLAPQDWAIRAAGEPYGVFYGLVTFSVGVDGVAVSHDGEWLYYATMSHDSAFRIPTEALRDSSLSDAQLAERIELVGKKPLSDGIEIDAQNNLYITDVENGGVARLSPDGSLKTMVKSEQIVWADGINLTEDGALLFTDSEIPSYIDQLLRPPPRDRLHTSKPHRIYRFQP